MKNKLITGYLLLCLGLFAGPSCSQEKQADANGDGVGTEDTFQGDEIGTEDSLQADAGQDAAADVRAWAPEELLPASPEAVLVDPEAGWLLVSNVNSHWDQDAGNMVFSKGYVTAHRLDDLTPLDRVDTSAPNPQALAKVKDGYLVLNSGTMVFDANWLGTPDSPGSLDLLTSDLELAASVAIPNGADGPYSGYPGSLLVLGGKAFLASGTAPVIWEVDLATMALTRSRRLHEKPGNELLALFNADGRLGVLAFNSDSLWILSPETLEPESDDPCQYPLLLDDDPAALSGPGGAVFAEGKIFVMNGIGATLSVFDPVTCKVQQDVAALGGAPNQVQRWDDSLLVVNSLDNNVQKLALAAPYDSVTQVVLPPGCNPWNAAVSADGIFISGNLDHTIYAAALTDGAITAVFPVAQE